MATAATAPPVREQVYCHECQNVWYRDEHGLVCPNESCRSDFVEIIENNNDPRLMADLMDFDEEEDSEDEDERHRHFHGPPFMPQASPGGGTTFFRAEGPNYSYISARTTIHPRPDPGNAGGGGSGGQDEIADMFSTIIRTILGDQAARAARQGAAGATPVPGGGGNHNDNEGRPRMEGMNAPPVYGVRLGPRNADGPQGEVPQVLDIHQFLASLFGPPPMGGEGPPPMFAHLFGMPPGAGGDYVYSQAELDRIISQLMEQHQGNAPPPAAKDDIDALPRIKVTEAMVLDGTDCAVCKEDLVIEEEVTVLPCKHTYHFECVSKWLEAHDTCPICRHPITPEDRRGHRQHQQHPQQSHPPTSSGSTGSSGGGGGIATGINIPFLNFFGGNIRAPHPPQAQAQQAQNSSDQHDGQHDGNNQAPPGAFPAEDDHSRNGHNETHDHNHDHDHSGGHRYSGPFSGLFRRGGS